MLVHSGEGEFPAVFLSPAAVFGFFLINQRCAAAAATVSHA